MKTFNHVSYLWDEHEASLLGEEQVDLLVYRSNMLGSDLRLTNFGGGNTSCKFMTPDPLTGEPVEVMWIKGSGGDLGTLKKKDLASLYMSKLRNLKLIYPGISQEDQMVRLLNYCLFDPESRAPSIDTALHGFLPFAHIDHLHPDAVISLAAAKEGKQITQELFDGKIGWVDWQRPGFDLGLKLKQYVDTHPAIRGIILGSHGLFTWGQTAAESYQNTLEVIETCAEYLEKHFGKKGPVFGGQRQQPPAHEIRQERAATLAPSLRGLCSAQNRSVGYFTDEERVMEFVQSHDLDRLASMGTSCPDHFLRTKISPLVLRLETIIDFSDSKQIREVLEPQFANYRKMYASYYDTCKHADSPAMRDPNPVVLLCPDLGMFAFAKDKPSARVAAEFYINAINVMKGAEAISEYTSLSRQEAFNIEYWSLEEAKLQRLPKPKALSGRIALVTGAAGGIGKAVAWLFAEEGACVVLTDNDPERLAKTETKFHQAFGKEKCLSVKLDVTDGTVIHQCFQTVARTFGGLDILVNSAGLSISKSLEEHTEKDWDLLYDVLVKGQFLVTQAAVALMRKQGLGGDILNIVSKNALVSGPNNAGYGSAKAAQLHLSRLNAAELGPDGIRVNVINPDAVIADSKIWEGAWAEGRAKAYGITVKELPSFYAKRTLLNEIILPEDIARACLAYVGGLLNKSTGNMLNVDGGIAAAFVR